MVVGVRPVRRGMQVVFSHQAMDRAGNGVLVGFLGAVENLRAAVQRVRLLSGPPLAASLRQLEVELRNLDHEVDPGGHGRNAPPPRLDGPDLEPAPIFSMRFVSLVWRLQPIRVAAATGRLSFTGRADPHPPVLE